MPGADIYILGQKYTIKGEASEKHIKGLADEINAEINKVRAKFPNISSTQALILTLLNLADELYRLRNEQEDITRGIKEKADILAGLFE